MKLTILLVTLITSGLLIQSIFFSCFITRAELSIKNRVFYILWGAICATLLSLILQVSYSLNFKSANLGLELMVVIAPFSEELVKVLPLLIIALLGKIKGWRVLLVACAFTGVGFHLTESCLYLLSSKTKLDYSTQIVFRLIINSFNHAFYSGLTGIGLGIATIVRSYILKLVFIFIGFSAAVSTHLFHNTLSALIERGVQSKEAMGAVVLTSFGLGVFYLALLIFARLLIKKSSW